MLMLETLNGVSCFKRERISVSPNESQKTLNKFCRLLDLNQGPIMKTNQSTQNHNEHTDEKSRRSFLKAGAGVAAAAAVTSAGSGLTAGLQPHVSGTPSTSRESINMALVGCGGRGLPGSSRGQQQPKRQIPAVRRSFLYL